MANVPTLDSRQAWRLDLNPNHGAEVDPLTGTIHLTPTSLFPVIPEYADNAAALAAGLKVGDPYHTAGAMKVVV